MAENESPPTDQIAEEKKTYNTNISMPKIVLTRIDEDSSISLNSYVLPEVKESPTVKKSLAVIGVKRSRGRPRKEADSDLDPPKKSKLNKTATNNKVPFKDTKNKPYNLKISPKGTSVQKGKAVKNVLTKTMLQTKSRIKVPISKKNNSVQNKRNKNSPQMENIIQRKIKKNSPEMEKLINNKAKKDSLQQGMITQKKSKKNSPQIEKKLVTKNIKFLQTKHVDTDSSEDDFLYDEIIEEMGNMHKKTTNITLKPGAGNKLPTIVKGGIIKKANLPEDLKPIATPNVTKSNEKSTKTLLTSTAYGKKKSIDSTTAASPEKKPSPWPVSLTNKLSKSTPNSNKNQKKANSPMADNLKQSLLPPSVISNEDCVNSPANIVSKQNPVSITKHKIGPKQTAKVTPVKRLDQEENLSDEYTEEETLESVDYDADDIFSKPTQNLSENLTSKKNTNNVKSSGVPAANPKNLDDDDDLQIDLLRIFSDDTEESEVKKSLSKDKASELKKCDLNPESKDHFTETEKDTFYQEEKEPPVRTIYDLMNEISLELPSWNLHIIPETSAFCIAQVTKGRLGLPTLKKCIELDPETYNAKVYIHQYHIKRFDGVYDSEESILALIQEINSIKA